MSDDYTDVRSAVVGADQGFQVVEGVGVRRRPPGSELEDGGMPPVTALGHLDGMFHLLDIKGQARCLSARQLGSRHELLSLFLGDDKWLRHQWPKTVQVKEKDEHGNDVTKDKVVDFRINSAAAWLQAECGRGGLYGDHIQLRRPGVWPEADGLPAVHCGDEVLIGTTWRKAGYRRDNQIWAAAPPTLRPGTPCSAAIGNELLSRIQEFWNFRRSGGPNVVLGLLGTAYYGAAAPWRSSGFLIGGAGSGKSTLLTVMRDACPLHHFTNDTTKAGLEQQISGRAMPSFIDEASDREDQRGARALLDLVLSAAGGEGTKGHRGGLDGSARKVEVVGSIIMASITPPDMQAQHLGRFTIVELGKPDDGEDHSGQHRDLATFARAHGPSLWGRAIGGWKRYLAALKTYREALQNNGCAPREMDQLGALLAGHWVLTAEGEPTAKDGLAGVMMILDFIRDGDEIQTDDAPRRMVNHLLSTMVMLDRSSAHEPVAALLRSALDPASTDTDIVRRSNVEKHLGNYGMRVIRAGDTAKDRRGRSAPRVAAGSGVWFHPRHVQLQKIFDGTPWQGDRWLYELRRLESSRSPKMSVRIGDMTPTRCIWVSGDELGFEIEEHNPDA